MKHKKGWLTTAHRGYVEGELKENSLAAYYNAYLHGADIIETDARLSSDGVLIVNHDADVKGFDENGEPVRYIVKDTPSEVILKVILSKDEKWGVQRIPTLEQVLHLAYNTGLRVNIDLKNGLETAEAVAKLVLKCGMQGKVIYALNGAGLAGINAIIAIDPDASFDDYGVAFAKEVKDYPERGKRCYCYTGDTSPETVNAIREYGCKLELISLKPENFAAAVACHPDICEFLHTSDFRAIEEDYLNNIKLF